MLKAVSLKDLKIDLDRAQKVVGLRDDLLKIRDGDVDARDVQILALQDALCNEKQRVERRNEEVLRLEGIVERRDESILELAEEKVELEVKIDEDAFHWEMTYAELEEELGHTLGHPVGSWQASEAADEEEHEQIHEDTDDLTSVHDDTKPDEIESALPKELEGRQDPGYHAGADTGRPPDSIHTRPKNPVEWSRLLMLADKFQKLNSEVMAIEYQDEDGPANIEGLSFEVLDKLEEDFRGGSWLVVDRASQTQIEGLSSEVLLDFEQYCEGLCQNSHKLRRGYRARMAQVFDNQSEEKLQDALAEESMKDSRAIVDSEDTARSGIPPGESNCEKTTTSGTSPDNEDTDVKPVR